MFDEREMDQIPPSEPIGRHTVTFDVPVPTIEQVAGQMARELLANYRYGDGVKRLMQDALESAIDCLIEEKAKPALEELIEKQIRPTDAFGNPTGESTTLSAVITGRALSWGYDTVDSDGRPAKSDSYTKRPTRIEWLIGRLVDRELNLAVNKEVKAIGEKLKAAATKKIAEQIAQQVSALVLK